LQAIELLKENPENIDWIILSANTKAIELLKENQNNINWTALSKNISIFE
jgi:hypothetical protein